MAILQEMAQAASDASHGNPEALASAWRGAADEGEPEQIALPAPPKPVAPRPSWDERTFEAVVESAADGLVICDADGSVMLVNAQNGKAVWISSRGIAWSNDRNPRAGPIPGKARHASSTVLRRAPYPPDGTRDRALGPPEG